MLDSIFCIIVGIVLFAIITVIVTFVFGAVDNMLFNGRLIRLLQKIGCHYINKVEKFIDSKIDK